MDVQLDGDWKDVRLCEVLEYLLGVLRPGDGDLSDYALCATLELDWTL